MPYRPFKKLRLSASKITTYKGCPLAYFLKYVEHVNVAEDVRAVFGKVIHSMLDKFYELNFKSADSFAGAWRFNWFRACSGETLTGKRKEIFKINEYPLSNGTIRLGTHVKFCKPNSDADPVGIFFGYMKLGENILKGFYEQFKDRPPPILREAAFEVNIKGNHRNHNVIVIYDRIDLKNGLPIIGDYKTDKTSPEESPEEKAFQLHRHPQFTLYSLAFRQLIKEGRLKGIIPEGIEKEAGIWYYHLRSGKIFQTMRSEKDYEYILNLLEDVTEGILSQKFTPFYGFHCSMCDYQAPCEQYSVCYGGPRIDLEGRIKVPKQISWDDDIEELWNPSQELNSFYNKTESTKEKYPRDKNGQMYFEFMRPQKLQLPETKKENVYVQRRFKWPKQK